MQQTHLIQRKVMDVTAHRQEVAEEVLDELQRIWQEGVEEQTDALFSSLCPAGETRVIERLEIDLGDVSQGNIALRYLDRLKEELARLDVENNPAQEEARIPAVLYFIQHGWLPWWAPVMQEVEGQAPSTAMLEALAAELDMLLQQNKAVILAWLQNFVPTTHHAQRLEAHFGIQRLILLSAAAFPQNIPCITLLEKQMEFVSVAAMQEIWRIMWAMPRALSDVTMQAQYLAEQVMQILANVHALPKQQMEQLIATIKKEAGTTEVEKAFAEACVTVWAEKEAGKTGSPQKNIIPQRTTKEIAESASEEPYSMPVAEEETASKPIEEAGMDIAITSFADAKRMLEQITQSARQQNSQEVSETDKKMAALSPDAPLLPVQENMLDESLPEKEKIAVRTSGIVLLHPYLSRFFTVLGLREEDKWKSLDAQVRAVQLLHFLATKETEYAEYELVLNKILCGLPINQPIPRIFAPTEQESEQCESLLKAVISHWTMLGNTSPDGLRQTFLRRVGLLHREGQQWYLQVENSAFDVLLGGLPWGYHLIKLSWMKQMLEVAWH